MKLIILKSNLTRGLYAVEKTISENTNLPILKNFLIEVKDKTTLISTNLELAVKYIITGKIIEQGEIAVPFNVFNSIIANLDSERITLEQKNKDLIISADNYEAVVHGQDPKEFPIIPVPQNKKQAIKIKSTLLKEVISQVIVATQHSDLRPEISGIFMNFIDNNLCFVATDSFRLAERKISRGETAVDAEKISAIIPIKTAQEILRLFTNQEEEVEIFIDPNQIVFQTPNQLIVSRLIEGSFPDYLSIIPKQIKTEVLINRREFLAAVKLTSAFSGRASDITLRTGESKKFLELFSSDNTLGENRYRIPIKNGDTEFSVVFNWRYLLDGLKIYKGENITLGINAPDKPVVIRGEGEQSLLYIVMPIKS